MHNYFSEKITVCVVLGGNGNAPQREVELRGNLFLTTRIMKYPFDLKTAMLKIVITEVLKF